MLNRDGDIGLSGGAVCDRSGRSRRFLCTFLRSFSNISKFLEKSSELPSRSESEPKLNVSPIGELDVGDGDGECEPFSSFSTLSPMSTGESTVSMVIVYLLLLLEGR